MKRSCKPRSYLLCAYLILFGSLLMLPSVAVSSKSLTPGQTNAAQQSVLLKGFITDKDGEPLVGVTIENRTAQKSVLTDIDGKYSISAKAGDVLSFRYIGMRTVEATVKQGQTTLDIVLETDENILDDVVVTGYQTISKERATGSYSILTSKNLENKTETNLISRIEGMIPGMVRENDGTQIIRGVASIDKGGRGVLYVVDNIPYEGAVGYINPSDVANITVLKDAAAASIYGARAANGVVVITTKKGQKGKIRVNYSANIHFTPVPDLDHLNLTNSEEFVDYVKRAFNSTTGTGVAVKTAYINQLAKYYLDPVRTSLVAHAKGTITEDELNNQLAYYSSLDNRGQIRDAFARTSVTHQHNFNVSGGSENYNFYLSLNYLENNPYDKYVSSKQYGFNSKNEFKISSTLKVFGNISGSFISKKVNNIDSESYLSMAMVYPSYYMIKDEQGELLTFPSKSSREPTYFSQSSIDQLIGAGLKDLNYYPTLDAGTSTKHTNTDYLRLQAGFNWDIIDGLTANATYQYEITNNKDKVHYLEDSYFMRSRINDAAQINTTTGVITFNVPLGGRMESQRSDSRAYTLRGQLDYKKSFGDSHSITALAGAERRAKRNISNGYMLLGYSENGMLKSPVVNSYKLTNTQSLSNKYDEDLSSYFFAGDGEDRYVAFYSNAAYSYQKRYDISGSIRLDESNLFGRAKENKYRPSWSLGGAWHISKEAFMKDVDWVDRLTLRITNGTGGVIVQGASLYEKIVNSGTQLYTLVPSTTISKPANPKLKWEKTYTRNFGLDYSVLNSRVRGGVDFYNKRSVDLLGDKAGDPTIGWETLTINYGKLKNNGYEFYLNIVPVKSRDLEWNMGITFGNNKNELTHLEKTAPTKTQYLYPGVLVVGKPLQSVFSTRYAQLNDKGKPLFYNKDNELVEFSKLTTDDYVYSGTLTPTSMASLMNTISFRNFDFSFKLMYYGGNIMRDQSKTILTGSETTSFNKNSLNFWQNPGDELNPLNPELPNLDIAPVLDGGLVEWRLGWLSRDTNVKKANYIKLRNIGLTYRVPRTFLNSFKIEQLALSFQINDLMGWYTAGGIDPEYNNYTGNNGNFSLSVKPKPTYSFNVNVNF